MRSAARVSALGLAASAAFLAAAPAGAAAPRDITGKLSKPGYTVIAFAANGKATSVRARRGSFRLVPPARRVTLHLRAPDGTYAGPVVVGRGRQRAIVGVRAGARLGRVLVRRSYAKPARRLPSRGIDPARSARARRGVPIGAGNFGRVRSRHARGGVPGDLDLDGIPDRIDIDDDGDLVLDDVDRSSPARASQAEGTFHVFSDLSLALDQTVNHDAGSTDADIDAALPTFGMLQIVILPGDSAELDCGGANQTPPRPEGLIYCRPHSSGGIGRIGGNCQACQFEPVLFPDCCDADGDGFGTLTPLGPPAPGAGPVGGMGITPNATTAQIGTGDVLIQWIATGVPASQCPPPSASCASFPSALQFVFATVPALKSFSDGQGPPVTITYPVPQAEPGREVEHPGGPGVRANPFPVQADPSTGDVTLTLTFWRAQRRPAPDEPGYSDPPTAWTDIGGLAYVAAVTDIGGVCPQSAFSEANPRDPNLTLATPNSAPKVFNNDRGGFVDEARDQPASTANTFSYRLNLTRCLARSGLSFDSGQVRGLDFQGVTPNFGGIASQSVFFRRE